MMMMMIMMTLMMMMMIIMMVMMIMTMMMIMMTVMVSLGYVARSPEVPFVVVTNRHSTMGLRWNEVDG